jgi:hypothetical protein
MLGGPLILQIVYKWTAIYGTKLHLYDLHVPPRSPPRTPLEFMDPRLKTYGLKQACQTQTTSRAAKETKIPEGAAKIATKIQSSPYFKKLELEIELIQHFCT